MLRVTLGFDAGTRIQGPNIKLQIPPAGVASPQWPGMDPAGRTAWPAHHPQPVSRTYTIRRLDEAAGELDIDFVLHGDEGPASSWAARAQIGDELGIAASGGVGASTADWYLLVGDHTAVPAIAALLESLPETARGHAIIEVPDEGEQQIIASHSQIQVQWLHSHDVAPGTTGALERAVQAIEWPDAQAIPFVWVGAESSAARAIRKYLREERGLDRRRMLVIGYWKQGFSETEYKERHDNDRDKDYYALAREAYFRRHGHYPQKMSRFTNAIRSMGHWWMRHFTPDPAGKRSGGSNNK